MSKKMLMKKRKRPFHHRREDEDVENVDPYIKKVKTEPVEIDDEEILKVKTEQTVPWFERCDRNVLYSLTRTDFATIAFASERQRNHLRLSDVLSRTENRRDE